LSLPAKMYEPQRKQFTAAFVLILLINFQKME